ncbi:MAG: hypothetical protein ACR2PA_20550 [Hyphomicrobiaceae bacterium]
MRADVPRHTQRRPDVPNGRLIAASTLMIGLLAVYFLILPFLPDIMHKPGRPVVYLLGVTGTLLLLVAGAFVLVKRTGRGGSPVGWFVAHVVCGNVGFVLVAIHTTGKLDRPPALLLLGLLALMALGIWARVRASRTMADTFGTKLAGFATPNVGRHAALRGIIDKKVDVLTRLDPAAHEATFSVTLAHLLRRPGDSIAYLQLARKEQRLIGARASVGPAQAWWRPLHLVLAAIFIVGLLIHVAMVTFFAGYVAEGGPITWWHLTAWDF